MVSLIRTVTMVLLLSVIPLLITPAWADQHQRRIFVALLANNAAFTRQLFIDDRLRDLYQGLDRERLRTAAALRRANLSERNRAWLREENDRAVSRIADLIDLLATKDAELATIKKSVDRDLAGLLASQNHAALEALERYASGDVSALDDMQRVIRLQRRANQAMEEARRLAIQSLEAKNQRLVAVGYTNASERGEQSREKAIAAWREALEIEPDAISAWIVITNLYHDSGYKDKAAEAGRHAFALVKSEKDRALVYQLFTDASLGKAPGVPSEKTNDEAALEIYQRLSATDPKDLQAKRELFYAFSRVVVLATSSRGVDSTASISAALDVIHQMEDLGENPDNVAYFRAHMQINHADNEYRNLRFAEAARNYQLGIKIAGALADVDADGRRVEELISRAISGIARVAVAQHDPETALSRFEEVAESAERFLARSPKSFMFRTGVWHAQSELGMTAQRFNRPEIARRAFENALTIGESFGDDYSQRYMVTLTLRRLSDVEFSVGNVTRAIALRQRGRELSAADYARNREFDSALANKANNAIVIGWDLEIANLNLIAGRTGDARNRLSAVQTALAHLDAIAFDEPIDAELLWVITEVYFARVARVDGKIEEARNRVATLLARIETHLKSRPYDKTFANALFELRLSAAGFPGFGVRWPDVLAASHSVQPSDSVGQKHLDAWQIFIKARIAMDTDADGSLTEWSVATVRELRRNYALARQLVTDNPDIWYLRWIPLHYMLELALIPETAVGWDSVRREMDEIARVNLVQSLEDVRRMEWIYGMVAVHGGEE